MRYQRLNLLLCWLNHLKAGICRLRICRVSPWHLWAFILIGGFLEPFGGKWAKKGQIKKLLFFYEFVISRPEIFFDNLSSKSSLKVTQRALCVKSGNTFKGTHLKIYIHFLVIILLYLVSFFQKGICLDWTIVSELWPF